MTFQAGRLRERLLIRQTSSTGDGQGGGVETHSTLDTVWGSVVPLTGRERFMAAQQSPEISHTVEIRYRSDVDENNWIALGSTAGKRFDIEAVVDPDMRNERLRLWVTERKPHTV